MIKLDTATANQAKAPVNSGAAPAFLNCPKDTLAPIPARAIAMSHCDKNFVAGTSELGKIPTLVTIDAMTNHKINQGKIFFKLTF